MTGYQFKVTVPTSYAALIEAMGSGNAQVGWLPPALISWRMPRAMPMSPWLPCATAPITTPSSTLPMWARNFTVYYDPKTGKDTADAATALAQFAGKKPCYTDPLSASGYLVPSGFLAANKIKTLGRRLGAGSSRPLSSRST